VTQEKKFTLGGPPLDDPRIIGAPIIAFYVIIVVRKIEGKWGKLLCKGRLFSFFFYYF
jgi:hypothetical protein